MMVTIKLLNINKLLNIMKNKYCILCLKNYLLKIMEDVAVGILCEVRLLKSRAY